MTDTSGTPAKSGGIDVVSLLKDGLATFKSGIQDVVSNVQGLAGQGTGQAAKAVAATKDEAEANSEIATIKAARDAKFEADNKATESAMGTLPGAASVIAANIRDNVLPKQLALQKDQDDLEAMKKVGPLDDIMQYAINSFTAPFKQRSIDQQQKDIDQRLGFSQKVTSLSNETVAGNNASDLVDATANASALSKLAVAQATQKAVEINDKAIALGINAQQVTQAATVQSMSVAFQYTNALFAQQSSVREALEADVNMAARTAATKASELDTKLKSDVEADKQASFAAIQDAALSKAGIKITSIQDLKMMSRPTQDALVNMAGNAQVTQGIDILSPTKSIDTLAMLGSNGPSPGVALVVNKLKDMSAPVEVNPAYLTLKREDKIPLMDAQIKQGVSTELANIPKTGGIYSPLTFDKTATLNPVISSLPLIQEMVAGGLGKDGTTPTNPDDFFASGASMIKRGVPVSDVAAQITATFQAVSTQLDNTRRYALVNIPGLAPNQPYKMAVHAPPGTEGLRLGKLPPIVDMNNKAAVQAYLTRVSAAQRLIESGGGVTPFVHQ